LKLTMIWILWFIHFYLSLSLSHLSLSLICCWVFSSFGRHCNGASVYLLLNAWSFMPVFSFTICLLGFGFYNWLILPAVHTLFELKD
jgi:hypothetical protein